MIKFLMAVAAMVLAVPVLFVVFLASPQASTEVHAIATACQSQLGAAPQHDTTVEQLGGHDAVIVAAALTRAAPTAAAGDTAAPTSTAAPIPGAAVAAALIGEKAYEFVTTLDTLDNWRSLPIETLARWAADPSEVAPPPGAVQLPELPADQTTALKSDGQPATAYARACAALVARATAATVHPAGDATGSGVEPNLAALAAMVGTSHSNLDLLRVVNPAAVQADPRLFYLDYRPDMLPSAGDIVVYDYTTAGPAHFGIAVDSQYMVTTGSVADGVVQTWPIPENSATMTARPVIDDQRKGTAS